MTQQKNEDYKALTEKTAVDLALKLGLFHPENALECKEIGDGNLNYVFRITNPETNKGVIIKQALPYAKVIGESWPLTIRRAVIESNALKIFGEYCPAYVPEVYYSDEKLAITIMEDLSHLTIARTGLIHGENYPYLSRHIGEYLAKTLFYTSDFFLEHEKKKELAVQFSNPELCKITESFVFTDPFFNSESNDFEQELTKDAEAIWADTELILEAAKLKKIFITEQEALLHGDLHTGSIFASSTETKVIDPEFAFYGPIGFDVGQILANLLFQAVTRTRNGKDREAIFNHLETVWTTFEDTFTQLWKSEGQEAFCKSEGYLDFVIQKIREDSYGFAGCELIRRTIGLSHVKDLDSIENKNDRIHSKKEVLQLGSLLIKQRQQLTNVIDAINAIELTPNY
jgi:5-methylthioribose kinase